MIRGDYGDGETRKGRLGTNYELVMRIVTQRFNESAAYAPVASGRSVSVTVRNGDTMSGITKRTVSVWSAPSGNINLIYPGSIVTYRGTPTAVSGSAATGGRVHIVKRGETLSGIFGADGW
ncbi:hypothetical protein DXC83_03390 [Bifidobacterium pseudocatenulatum]|jgi:hypothetical protein|nr:hypothetical protein DXC83_03390 [Bifidobacterium pseudocatenulatum]